MPDRDRAAHGPHRRAAGRRARHLGDGVHAVSAGDGLLNVHEAAQLLAVQPATLYQWAYQRRLPVVKLFGPRGPLRFRRSDLDALIVRSVRPALRAERDEGGVDP